MQPTWQESTGQVCVHNSASLDTRALNNRTQITETVSRQPLTILWLTQLLPPGKPQKIQLMKERKPTPRKVQQQYLKVMKTIMFPNPQFHYPGLMVPYVEGPKKDWTADNALHSRFVWWKSNVRTFLTVSFQYFKRVLNARKWFNGQEM